MPTRLTIGEALAHYAAQAGQAKVQEHVAIIRRYLAWGGTAQDARLAAYCRYLADEQGLKDSTIALHVRIIRAFYRSLGITPPKAPPLDESGVRIALTTDQVRRLIAVVRTQDDPVTQGIWALATLYGMRAEELTRVRGTDLDCAHERLYIRTAKGGTARWCWLPPAVHEPLMRWAQPSRSRVYRAWRQAWASVESGQPSIAGTPLPATPRLGWHAVRRALVRDLMQAGVPEDAVVRFLRWRVGGSSAHRMATLYANPTAEIGPNGQVQATAADPGTQAADAAVWAHHPYLAAWT